MDYKELTNKVFNYPTKYKAGFINAEIETLLEELNINEKKFNKSLGTNTVTTIDGNIVYYHNDILKGIICCIENRTENFNEWD